MEVTILTWTVAITGLLLIGLLSALQLVAVVTPRGRWTIENVYRGNPDATDPNAYFAFNQGQAWADSVFWAPLQIAGSVGMVLGQRWGFLLALAASVPCWYSAVSIFISSKVSTASPGSWTRGPVAAALHIVTTEHPSLALPRAVCSVDTSCLPSSH